MAANCVHHQMETRKLHRILLSIFLSVLCVCVIVNINYSMGSHCTCTWQTATEAMRRDFYQTQWRLINHFVVDYRPELAVRLDRLTSMKAEANNPEVIALARDVIEPLPSMPALMRLSHVITRTPQAESVDNITEHMVRFMTREVKCTRSRLHFNKHSIARRTTYLKCSSQAYVSVPTKLH
jgi:hypothetical protein